MEGSPFQRFLSRAAVLQSRLGLPVCCRDFPSATKQVFALAAKAVDAMVNCDWDRATGLLGQVLERKDARPVDRASARVLIAVCHETKGQMSAAREALDAALVDATDDSAELTAVVKNDLGYICQVIGPLERAEACHAEALGHAVKAGSAELEGWAHHFLGGVRRIQGRLEQAKVEYGSAIATARNCQSRLLEAWAAGGLGLVYRRKAQSARALASLRDACQLFMHLANQRGEGWAQQNIAVIYAEQGRWGDALHYIDESIRCNDRIKRLDASAPRRKAMFLAHGPSRNYVSALTFLDKALEVDRKTGDRLGEARSLADLGFVHYHIYLRDGAGTELDRARTYCSQALEIVGARSPSDKAWVLENLGLVQFEAQDYEAAITSFGEALEIAEQTHGRKAEARLLGSLGECHRVQGRLELAEDEFTRAAAACEESGLRTRLPWTLRKLGQTLIARARHRDAIVHLEKGFAIAQEVQLAEYEWKGLALMAEAHSLDGNVAAAFGCIERARQYAFRVGTARDQRQLTQTMERIRSRPPGPQGT